MVGLLKAPPGTKLHHRLKKENRLLLNFSGDNTDCSMNFIPKMDYATLINGYRRVLNTIYSPKHYYERARTFLNEYKPRPRKLARPQSEHFVAFVRSVWVLGIKEKGSHYYWRFLAWTLARRPQLFPLSVKLAIYGFHFRKVLKGYTEAPVLN